MPPYRLLVTGSRHYSDEDKVRRALWPWTVVALALPARLELVHGACPFGGLDLIASRVWGDWGFPVLAMPAETSPRGRFMGPERNQKMVDLGGYAACLGFPIDQSYGTRDCMRRADAAGILTLEVK
jgi:hypothetical protein